MKKLLVSLFIVFVASQGQAGIRSCSVKMAELNSVRLQSGIEKLREMGLKTITTHLDASQINIQYVRRYWFNQPIVKGKIGITGKRKLFVRKWDETDTKQNQRALWDLASCVYSLQVSSRMWSAEALHPSRRPSAQITLTADLDEEMYKLFDYLTELSPEEFLLKEDNVSLWTLSNTFKIIRPHDTYNFIGPNQADYIVWKANPESLRPLLSERHRKPIFVNYWLTHIKRVLIAGLLIANAPHLVKEIQHLPEQARTAAGHAQLITHLDMSQAAGQELRGAYAVNLREKAEKRQLRLQAELSAMLNDPSARPEDIKDHKDELNELTTEYQLSSH